MDYKECIQSSPPLYDPSLLVDSKVPAAITLCTDDAFQAITKSRKTEEQNIADRIWSPMHSHHQPISKEAMLLVMN